MPLDEPPLSTVLDEVADGRIRLPDFQRNWLWDDERIISILATVTMSYPMGVIMTLETGGPGAVFKTRPLEGTQDAARQAEQLLLDGQQRMTSLFQALRSGHVVETVDQRGKELKRWYYIDIHQAIDPLTDRELAIRSVPEDRIIRSDFGRKIELDLSTGDRERAQAHFPLHLAFDNDRMMDWMFQYVGADSGRRATWTTFKAMVIDNLTQYRVPIIKLSKDTPKVAVCTVFEKVNTGGVPLTVFELLTATFAAEEAYSAEHGHDFHLPDHWASTHEELSAAYPVLSGLQSTDFLQAVCLASTYHEPGVAVSCKRKDMLELKLGTYLDWAPKVTDALHWAGRFLEEQCVFRPEDLPYRQQLQPLAAIRTVLGAGTDGAEAREKLARWYWCGVFGEQYGGSPDSRFPRDVEQVVGWIRGGRAPDSVQDARFVETRLLSMTTRNSAAYTGVFALLLKQGCTDWFYSDKPLTGDLIDDYKVDIYRIFPAAWCKKQGIEAQRQNSVVNKTLLSHRASRALTTRPPDVYLKVLERESGIQPNWLDDALLTHLIEPLPLRAGDFDAFFARRMAELVRLIEEAMGRKAVRAEEES
ncbi:hypothetical protein DPM19_09355 [Actinomadura craniellae]|uniref:GmrSD restriction endonucleases N-terminal domain-containing protein n=1 Tax=Actinomadura craniellae TaxID=2231787 RepID=A0A365HA23_9ACTN|nr:DUF262 domain-containing protein [Actinomadura craniellae]RAY15945.1 hypothetical protein DPM19_09355 [Actinomadura craniellae]